MKQKNEIKEVKMCTNFFQDSSEALRDIRKVGSFKKNGCICMIQRQLECLPTARDYNLEDYLHYPKIPNSPKCTISQVATYSK
ncbi:hypothetical protein KFK09_023232 [Dendrobium nobile]|uniref:Uncharacterized protein n=1 Tax=Dendrobium nobile TaxID=94219 RepID=A0A8T3AK48_DENNO|nr:hypothetical protein KFK09_023232 [Dendrobium nobile]